MFPSAQDILAKIKSTTSGALDFVTRGNFSVKDGAIAKTPEPVQSTETSVPTSQDILNKIRGQETKTEAPGLVKTLAKEAVPAATGALETYYAKQNERRAQQTLLQRAQTEIIQQPLQIVKAVGFDLPRLVLGGFSGVGKSLLEAVYAPVFGKEQVRTALAGDEQSKAMERGVFAMETKTWQEVKDKVDAYTETSPLANPWEKKNLGTVLAAGGFIADSYTGGGGKGKLAQQAIDELIKVTDENLAREALVKYGVPTEVADDAASGIARATSEQEVRTELRDASVRVLQRSEAGAAPESSGEIIKRLGLPESAVTAEKPVIKEAVQIPEAVAGKEARALSRPEPVPPEIASLATEAKKYKSAEEFVKAQEEKGYRSVHQVDTQAASPVTKISEETLATFTDEFKRQYGYPSLKSKEVNKLKSIISNPDANVTIYRASPKNELNSGDWVTIDKDYANDIKKQNGGKVYEYTVKAKDLFYPNTVGGFKELPSLNKWGAFRYQSSATKSQLTDLWKRANETAPAPEAATGKEFATPVTTEAVPSVAPETVVAKVPGKTDLVKSAEDAPTIDLFREETGNTPEALDAPAKKEGYEDAIDLYDKNRATPVSEIDSFNVMAEQEYTGDYALKMSTNQYEAFEAEIRETFTDLKGVSAKDLAFKFTEEDLENARQHFAIINDALVDHPGRALAKYVSRSTGELPEFTGRGKMKAISGSGKTVASSEWAQNGDKIFQDLVGQELSGGGDVSKAQEFVDDYLAMRKQVKGVGESLKEIRREIRLKKQLERFTEDARAVIARKVVRDTDAMKSLVENIGKSAYLRGFKEGSGKYKTLVKSLVSRRTRITAIKKHYNLTDAEMYRIRGKKDPRFMTGEQFDQYLAEVDSKALLQREKNDVRALIDNVINEKDLKKTENLQRALEYPPLKDMDKNQLVEYARILSETEAGDTFLTARMIQTAVNTDLGAIRTLQDGIKAIRKQSGMPHSEPVEGAKMDSWLRDPTLVERDPFHKLYITEFTARDAQMQSKKFELQREINTLASAARKSRRAKDALNARRGVEGKSLGQRILARFAPQDELVVKWLQPFETVYEDGKKRIVYQKEIRERAASAMTKEELDYAQFLEKFFTHYYRLAADEAQTRWTLLGVKHTNYRSIYYAHMNRGFFERWKDDGLVKAMKMMWSKDVADAKIDFNAFGDRGEVLGYEKWLNRSMVREGEGVDKETGRLHYTQNTAQVAMAYFHSFERKLILDSMIPKIKLLEFLMAKRFETPKSISNPEGAEQIHSLLRRHVNEWINNKKGQRVEMVYEQGDAIEAVVDTAKTFVAIEHLGMNVVAQVISGAGGEAINLSGLGIWGWAKGHARALTKQGTDLAEKYAGIIGEKPWEELGNAANDAGDTLRGGLFYLFGDLSYRARRQMMLALVTDKELATGEIAAKRVGEIKLQIGKWHPLPEFRSVKGSTSLVKAAAMYSEWAVPAMQQTYFVLLPRLRNMVRNASTPEDWKDLAKSEEFTTLFRMVVGGAALSATAYLILNPDQNDRSMFGYARRKAAQEVSSTVQAISLVGIPTPFAIMNGYVDSLRTGLGQLVALERYTSSGPGYKEGSLKGINTLERALIPRGIKMWFGEPETPIKTEEELKAEIKKKVESGELSIAAAKIQVQKELKSIHEKQKNLRFAMSESEYKSDLKERVKAGEISIEDAKTEAFAYLKQKKEQAPESFESDNDASFIDKVGTYAKAIGTDPVTAFWLIFSSETIRRTDNGAIIVRRMSFEESQAVKKERGSSAGLVLDHTLPLQLGGTNSGANLKLVPKADWERYTPIENYLGQLLRSGEVDPKKAKQLITDFKEGKIDEKGVYAATGG